VGPEAEGDVAVAEPTDAAFAPPEEAEATVVDDDTAGVEVVDVAGTPWPVAADDEASVAVDEFGDEAPELVAPTAVITRRDEFDEDEFEAEEAEHPNRVRNAAAVFLILLRAVIVLIAVLGWTRRSSNGKPVHATDP